MTQLPKVENIENVVTNDEETDEEEYVEELDDFEDLKEVEREMQARHPFPAVPRQNNVNVTVKAVPYDMEVEFSRWLNLDSEDDNRNASVKTPRPRSRPPKRRRETDAVPQTGSRASVIVSTGSAPEGASGNSAGGSGGAPGTRVTIAVEDIPLPPPRNRWLSMDEQTQAVLGYLRDTYGPDYDFHQPPPPLQY